MLQRMTNDGANTDEQGYSSGNKRPSAASTVSELDAMLEKLSACFDANCNDRTDVGCDELAEQAADHNDHVHVYNNHKLEQSDEQHQRAEVDQQADYQVHDKVVQHYSMCDNCNSNDDNDSNEHIKPRTHSQI